MSTFFKNDDATVLTEQQKKQMVGLKDLIETEYEFKMSLTLSEMFDIAIQFKDDDDGQTKAIQAILDADDNAPSIDASETEEDTDVTTKTDISAQDMPKDIRELAERLDSIKALNEHLIEAVETDSKRRRGPAVIAFDLRKEFTDEEVDKLIDPGSRYDDSEHGYGDSGNQKPYDVRKAGEGSHYGDVAKTMQHGKELVAELNEVLEARDEKQQTPTKYKNKPDTWLEQEEQTKRQAVNAFAKSVKEGFLTLKNLRKVKLTTKLLATLATEKHGKEDVLMRGNCPIRVYYLIKDKDSGSNVAVDRYVSVSTFNKKGLIEKIAAMANPEDQVNGFVIKKGKKAGNAETGNVMTINKPDHYVEATYLMAGIQKSVGFKGEIMKIVASKDGGEFLDTLDQVANFAREVFHSPDVRAKLAQYREDQAAMELKEQAEKTKKAA